MSLKKIFVVGIYSKQEQVKKNLKYLLSNSGYEVVDLGEEPEKSLNRAAPHVVVVDLDSQILNSLPALLKFPLIGLVDPVDRALVTRGFSLGLKVFLPKPLQRSEFFQVLHRMAKPFPNRSTHGVVTLTTRGKIISANEVGFLIESNVKMAGGSPLALDSEYLETLGLKMTYYRRTPREAVSSQPGLYVSEVTVVGLQPAAIRRMREMIK